MNHAHLSHIDIKGYYQFITFRTADSTDSFLSSLATQSKPNREKQMAMDEYLDASQQGTYLNGHVLRFLSNFIRSKDGDLYELVCFAVMPNHVHMLVKPLQKLALVMQRVKGASAKGINDLLGRRGSFWEKDYYDKAIRDEDHFRVVYRYIKNNPLKLGNSATEVAPPKPVLNPGSATLVAQNTRHPCALESAPPNAVRFYGVYDV